MTGATRRSLLSATAWRRASPTPAPQAKLRIGSASDPLEREADRVADAIISNQAMSVAGASDTGVVRPKCAACEAEERETVRMQPSGGTTTGQAHPSASYAADAVAGGGAPLSSELRAYFEPRFGGRDLSAVRVHTHRRAHGAAAALGARAYTLGSDIAFAPGEYSPGSPSGRHLLAHELAHVAQQGPAPDRVVRRATVGSGKPPAFGKHTLAVIPKDELAHVREAMARVDEIVDNRDKFSVCHDHFAEKCPKGTAGTLTQIWRRAVIWKMTSADPGILARGDVNGVNIAYTPDGYDEGVDNFAQTLLHEAGHNCGITGDAHWRADQIAAYCLGGGPNEFTISAGGNSGQPGGIFLLSYRRALGDWAAGRFRLTLGADLNVLGTAFETEAMIRDAPAKRRFAGEFGSAIVGGQLRLGGWGGPRFGGFNVRVDTGFGVGRFALRPALPEEEPSTAVAGAWILQVGPRAEFVLPIGGGRVIPTSLGAAYRLVQPLNSEAQALHGILGSVEFRF